MVGTKRRRSLSAKYWRKKRRFQHRLWKRSMRRSTPIVHRFKRTFVLFNQSFTTGGYAGFNFKFNMLPNYAEFQALFDSYQITLCVLKFYCGYDGNDLLNTVAQSGWLHIAKDFNDSTQPSNFDELREYNTYRCIPLPKCQGAVVKLRPRASQELYRSTITTSYAMAPKNLWCDMTTAGVDIPFYGLKTGIEGPGGGTDKYLRCTCTMYFKCKTIK